MIDVTNFIGVILMMSTNRTKQIKKELALKRHFRTNAHAVQIKKE